MQNSTWKLAALAGVVALGFFAVLQTQRGLQSELASDEGAPEIRAESDDENPHPDSHARERLASSQYEPTEDGEELFGRRSTPDEQNEVPDFGGSDSGRKKPASDEDDRKEDAPSFGSLDETPPESAKESGNADSKKIDVDNPFAIGGADDSTTTGGTTPDDKPVGETPEPPGFGTVDLGDSPAKTLPDLTGQPKTDEVTPIFGGPEPKESPDEPEKEDAGPSFGGGSGGTGGGSSPGVPGDSTPPEPTTGDRGNPFGNVPRGGEEPDDPDEMKITPRNRKPRKTRSAESDAGEPTQPLFGGSEPAAKTERADETDPDGPTTDRPFDRPSGSGSETEPKEKSESPMGAPPFAGSDTETPAADVSRKKSPRADEEVKDEEEKEDVPAPLFAPQPSGETDEERAKDPPAASETTEPKTRKTTEPKESQPFPDSDRTGADATAEDRSTGEQPQPSRPEEKKDAPRLMPDSEAIQLLPGSAAESSASPPPTVQPESESGSESESSTDDQAQLTIEKTAPKSAVLGKPFVYDILIRNRGTATAHQVTVEDPIPGGVRLDGSDPQAVMTDNKLVWKLGKLPAGETRKISVKVTPVRAGQIGSVATVNFVSETPVRKPVVAPKLSLQFTGPKSAKVGDKVTFRFVVTNSGSAEAKDVWVRDLIPDGLKHPGGNDLEYKVGALAPGKSETVSLEMTVAKAGKLTNRAIVTAAGGVRMESKAVVAVSAPNLVIARSGPKQRTLGSKAVFQNMLKNASGDSVRGATLSEVLPAGMEFLAASDGGRYDEATRTVSWNVGELGPNESKTVQLTLLPKKPGDQQSVVKAKSSDGAVARATSVTKVAGYAALGMEVPAIDAPISIGEQVTLRIVARNRGTAASANAKLKLTLPAQLEVASVRGPGKYTTADNTLTFEPVASVDAKQQVAFDVTLKAVAAGDSRVRVQIQSDEMSKPLSREEAVLVLPQE